LYVRFGNCLRDLKSLPDRLTTATTQTVSNFIEHFYFPHVATAATLAPSTVFGYKHIFSKHLRDRLASVRLCDFRTATGQRLLGQIAEESGLSNGSLKHIKWFLVAALNYAKQIDALQVDGNPMEHTQVPKGAATEQTKAYSLKEISSMIAALENEPTASAVIATAAFTGLRRQSYEACAGPTTTMVSFLLPVRCGTRVNETRQKR
jgi:hypothetical protein